MLNRVGNISHKQVNFFLEDYCMENTLEAAWVDKGPERKLHYGPGISNGSLDWVVTM